MITFFVIYFCGIWAFSSSRKHLLITLMRMEFLVLVLYFSIYLLRVSVHFDTFFREPQSNCTLFITSSGAEDLLTVC